MRALRLGYPALGFIRVRSSRAWLWCVCLCVPACASTARPIKQAPAAQLAEYSQPMAADSNAPTPELFVRCEDSTSCPDAVGMLVVDSGSAAEPERCTATLIEGNRVMTASHCLSPSQRRAGASCARTWVLFPATAHAPAESIACSHVVTATHLLAEDALQQEHAILQLTHASTRTALAVNPQPLEPGSIVTVVSVTPHPIYGCTHALATRLCRVIDSSPAERALGDAAANVGWLANCPIARGNSGSPVLDYDGRVRAIVHGGTALSSAFGVTSAISD